MTETTHSLQSNGKSPYNADLGFLGVYKSSLTDEEIFRIRQLRENTQKRNDEWQLGNWLPITFERPNTEAEIDYMEFVRSKVTKEHDEYIEKLKQK